LFDNLDEVRQISQEWVHDYNHNRPHDALGGLSPMMWKYRYTNKPSSADADDIPTSGCNNNNKIEKLKEKSTFDTY
ncbi:MAG TPA: integrase core domain-containing protein, partial [Segetibacter sp.]